MGLRFIVISLGIAFAFHASAANVDGNVMNKKLTCANYLTLMLRQNRFIATSMVIPILPYGSMLQPAQSKFADVLTYFNLETDARSANPRKVRLMVHITGLNREMGDGRRFIDEMIAYGLTVDTRAQKNVPEYFSILEGPSRLILDVVGHPAVSVVVRVLK